MRKLTEPRGVGYPPTARPTMRKLPSPKNSANARARVPEEIGPSRVTSLLHPYGMVQLLMPGGGRSMTA